MLDLLEQVDGFRNTGCYNALCPGFVQIDPVVRPGLDFVNTSTRGGDQYIVELHISQVYMLLSLCF